MIVNARDVEFHKYRNQHPRPQPSTESTPFNTQTPRSLEVQLPAPPANRNQYISDPDGNISNPDGNISDPDVISDDVLPSQSSIVQPVPAV